MGQTTDTPLSPDRQYVLELLAERNVSLRAASLAMNRNEAHLRNFIKAGRPRVLHETDRAALVALYGADPNRLVPPGARALTLTLPPPNARPAHRVPDTGQWPQDLPVRGTAEGSLHGSFELGSDVADYCRRPPPLMGVSEAYAIFVIGTSMSPAFESGDLAFIHPRRPPRAGDYVVLQIRRDEHAPLLAYLKKLVSMNDAWVVVEQHNPPARMKFARVTVVAVHRVLRPGEIMGS